jgi:curved DNA-binding protein CbpA
MNPLQDRAASDLIATVLACHRAPAMHGEILRGDRPVPSEMNVLFRLAGGSDFSELGLQGFAERDLENLQEACRFYIEQTLFRRDADHYRLLGLNPGADEPQIKEHHRLLMRLFHPDRLPESNDWKDNYVNRINHAYNVLRDESSRQRYDMERETEPMTTDPAQAGKRSPVIAGYRSGRNEAYPSASNRKSQRVPIYVMSGVALSAILFVGSVYLDNRPRQINDMQVAGAVQSSDGDTGNSRAARLAGNRDDIQISPELEARLDDLIAMDKIALAGLSPRKAHPEKDGNIEKMRGNSSGVAGNSVGSMPKKPQVSASAPVVTSTSKSTSALVSLAPEPPTTPSAMPASNPASLKMASAMKPAPSMVDAPVSLPMPSAQAAPPAPSVQADADMRIRELEKLLFRYVLYYERGDITAFLALFDDGARANAGGKPRIRQEYERFFKNTQIRNLDFGQAHWKTGDDSASAKIPYRAILRAKGDSENKVYSGVLFVEATSRGGDYLISALFDSSGDMP